MIDTFILVRQAVLFAHVVAFAIALGAVLREDLALVKARRIDPHRLADTARLVTCALIALWLTGLALTAFEIGLEVRAFNLSPKLAAKLFVVSALTANGLALHALAFPLLSQPRSPDRAGLLVPVVLGAISTASWLYASFIGVSRTIAPWMNFIDFIALYGVLLTAAIVVALAVVLPRVRAGELITIKAD